MRELIRLWTLGIFIIVLVAGLAYASTPTIVALQGKLTNQSTGATIQQADLRVNISSTSGQTIWNQTFQGGVDDGFADILLGTDVDNPLNLTYNQDYNISVYVGDSQVQVGGTYRFRSGVGLISPSNLSSGNFTAPGNFSFGSTFFIDQENGRVGIGTTGPSAEFTIEGDTGSSAGQMIGSDGFSTLTLSAEEDGGTGGSPEIRLDTQGSERWRIGALTSDSNKLMFSTGSLESNAKLTIDAGGQIGIGTTSPGAELDIASTSPRLIINETDTDAWKIGTDSGHLEISNIGEPQDYIRFDHGSAKDLELQPDGGNVGIGDTSPDDALEVLGNIRVSGSLNATSINVTDFIKINGNEVLTSATNSSLWNQSGSDIFPRDIAANVGIGTTGPNKNLVIYDGSSDATISINTDDTGTAATDGFQFAVQQGTMDAYINQRENAGFIFNTNNTERLRIDSSGNVGIGTASPQYLLQTASGTDGRDVNLSNTLFVNSSSGNVGIGTTDPVGRLHAEETSEMTSGSAGVPAIYVPRYDDANKDRAAFSVIQDDGTAVLGTAGTIIHSRNRPIAISTENKLVTDSLTTTPALFIEGGNGNVGLGTTTPQYRLQTASGTDGRDVNLSDTLYVNGSSGNVGIGTTSPTTLLNIYANNADTTQPNLALEQDGTGDTSVYFVLPGDTGYSLGIDNSDGNKFKLSSGTDLGSDDRVTIDGGNVGIGAASPTKRLEVSDSTQSLTFDPSAAMPTINTSSPGGNAQNLTIASEDGSIIMQLG